jgi:hypothetical protein
MDVEIVLLLLALVFGGVGLLVAGLRQALAVAVVLVLISALSRWSRRSGGPL